MERDDNNKTVVAPSPADEMTPEESEDPGPSGLPHFKLIVLLGLGIPLVFFTSQVGITAYQNFLESSSPEIAIANLPRGIGLTTVSVNAKVTDIGAGLDEINVSFVQRGRETKLFKKDLDGESSTDLNIEFPGDKSIADEGAIELTIKAFDKSFWSNRGELSIPLRVDYHRPKLEVVSAQHNARRGGSQLIIFRAFDEELAETGVKVGGQLFNGYPARGIDKDLDQQALFVALYTPDFQRKAERTPPRLFAEDRVGNVSTINFYNKIAERAPRRVTVKVTEPFMRDRIPTLLDQAMPSIEEWAARAGQSAPKGSGKSGKELLVFNFGIVNDLLRKESDVKLAGLLRGPKYERLWSGAFEKPVGTIDTSFGDLISYEYEGKLIGEALQIGYDIRMPSSQREVSAMNDGLVIFSDNIGTYGRAIGIDHGLGLVSIYAHLNSANVSKGDKVTKGQAIGEAGVTGLAQELGVFIQLRLHGVPVDLVEWWDKEWYYNHFVEKINDVKKVLGVSTFVPLDSALP